MGGGGFTAEPGDPALDELVLQLAGAPVPRILFLPTASGDPREQIARFHAAFGDRPCEPDELSLFRLGRGAPPAARHRALPGRDLRRRRLDAQPARDLARPRPRRAPARGVGARRRARRPERGRDVLVRGRGDDVGAGPRAGHGLGLPARLAIGARRRRARAPAGLPARRCARRAARRLAGRRRRRAAVPRPRARARRLCARRGAAARASTRSTASCAEVALEPDLIAPAPRGVPDASPRAARRALRVAAATRPRASRAASAAPPRSRCSHR